jgi:hypothetical protein
MGICVLWRIHAAYWRQEQIIHKKSIGVFPCTALFREEVTDGRGGLFFNRFAGWIEKK